MKITIALLAIVAASLVGPVVAQAAPKESPTLAALDYIQENLEGLAEGAVTGSLGNTVGHRVAADWSALRPSLASQGADQTMLKAVDSSIDALNASIAQSGDLRVAANDVTGAIAPVFGFAGAPVPWELNKMEYLRRAVGLAADTKNWARAESSTTELTQMWDSFKPRVISHNARKAADRFSDALAGIKSASDKHDAQATVKAVDGAGDAVDGIETAFGG